MRVSLSQQVQGALMYIDVSSRALSDAQTRAVSGKRILKASDDVPGTNIAMGLRSSISNTAQYSNNIVIGKPLLTATMAAVSDMTDAVQSVRDIAVQAANPDYTGEARAALLTQLDDIQSQMLDIANTKHADMYVFSGTATSTSPVTLTNGTYSYQGDDGQKKSQVLGWVTLPLNIPGAKVFNFDKNAGSDTTDVFTMVTKLKEAITGGDASTISKQLNNIDANYDNLLTSSAKLGSWSGRMDSAKTSLEDTTDRLKEMLSDTEDVDMTQAIVDLKTKENVYQTALTVTTQILNMSLASKS